MADPAVRHRGTLGGSLAHADPAGDLPAVAVALGATLLVRGPGGEREVAGGRLLRRLPDHQRSQPGEILIGIRVPKLGDGWGYRYEKFHRTAQAWAIVGVAAVGPPVERLGGRGPDRADQHGLGAGPGDRGGERRGRRGRHARGPAARPPSTPRTAPSRPATCTAPPDYRRHLAKVLTGRALAAAAGI